MAKEQKDIMEESRGTMHDGAANSKLTITTADVKNIPGDKGYDFSCTEVNPLDNNDFITLIVYPGGFLEQAGKNTGERTDCAHSDNGIEH